MTTAMVTQRPAPLALPEIQDLAGHFLKSGLFSDVRDESQAVVKILAGQEIGVGPFAAMKNIFIIKNRTVMAAELMASQVKASGRYDYRVIEHTERICTIAFLQAGEEIGRSTFTWADAERADLSRKETYRAWPRNMLWARAMSNGVRWHCPDIFGGATFYTPEEAHLSVSFAEDGSETVETPLATEPWDPLIGTTTEGVDYIQARDGKFWTPSECKVHGHWTQTSQRDGSVWVRCTETGTPNGAHFNADGYCVHGPRELLGVEIESLALDSEMSAVTDTVAAEASTVESAKISRSDLKIFARWLSDYELTADDITKITGPMAKSGKPAVSIYIAETTPEDKPMLARLWTLLHAAYVRHHGEEPETVPPEIEAQEGEG